MRFPLHSIACSTHDSLTQTQNKILFSGRTSNKIGGVTYQKQWCILQWSRKVAVHLHYGVLWLPKHA